MGRRGGGGGAGQWGWGMGRCWGRRSTIVMVLKDKWEVICGTVFGGRGGV